MKKKAIEKIPYLTGQKCNKRKIKYVAAVAMQDIDNEAHLILEVYENNKKSLVVPLIRLVYTKKDWGNYKPEDGKWSSCSITDDCGDLLWDRVSYKDENTTYISEQDIEKIRTFSNHRIYRRTAWWSYLEAVERDIRRERESRRYEKRREGLADRCAAVPELPEEFENWYKNTLFAGKNYIYYKRKGRYATFWCSHCGKSYTYATEARESYEGQFETIVSVPRRGQKGRCEKCDAVGYYKTAGTMEDVYGLKKMVYVGQQYKTGGFVSRYIQVEKYLSVGEPERFSVIEIARSFFEKNNQRIKDYNLHNRFIGRNEWCDHNIGGMGAQVHEGAAVVYPGTYDALRETDFKYCALEKYMENYEVVELPEYLEMYNKYPQIEMLVKFGLQELVTDLLQSPWKRMEYIANKDARRIEDFVGINKQHIKLFVERAGNPVLLKVLQLEHKLGVIWTEQQCIDLTYLSFDEVKLRQALQYMSAQKLINHIEKYAEIEISEGLCGQAVGRLSHVATTYLDYLSMRRACGYDMTNTVYLYPRDLDAAHQMMVLESNKKEIDNRVKIVEDLYPDIRRRYRSLRKKYYYEDDTMIIRPAKSAEEIVVEGCVLHHCVGGDNYLEKHNEGASIILMLRFKKTCNIPYITVEIRDEKIQQWYGAHDKKPDEKNMQKWLNAYVERLKQKKTEMLIETFETVAI